MRALGAATCDIEEHYSKYTHIEHTVPTHKKDINKKGALDCTVALFPDD
jgi:hypothetical protein